MGHISLEQIHRFPVKGFPGQTLHSTALEAGKGIKFDRRFAITNGVESDGGWMPPRNYFINATTEGLPGFNLDLDENADRLTLVNNLGAKICVVISDEKSLENANSNMKNFMGPVGIMEDMPPPRIVELTGPVANWDYQDTPLSIINLDTLAAIASQIGAELDERRFRGNLLVSGLDPWEEFDLLGKRIKLGESELEFTRPIDRCPAPDINPETGKRDIAVADLLVEHFGHVFCGMYARVVRDGKISVSDPIEVLGNQEPTMKQGLTTQSKDYRLWPRPVVVSRYAINAETTELSIKSANSLPLPNAMPGQRVRFHLGKIGWTAEYVTSATSGEHLFEVEKSWTSDPVTEHLRTRLATGDKILVSGPFGRAKA